MDFANYLDLLVYVEVGFPVLQVSSDGIVSAYPFSLVIRNNLIYGLVDNIAQSLLFLYKLPQEVAGIPVLNRELKGGFSLVFFDRKRLPCGFADGLTLVVDRLDSLGNLLLQNVLSLRRWKLAALL